MTYLAKEESTEGSAPVMLYQFSRGTDTWRYCSLAQDFTQGGYTWTHEAILPDRFNFTGDMPKENLSIRLPVTNAVADSFLPYPPDKVTTLTVFRTHYDDSAAITYWKGRVVNTTATGGVMTLDCEPVFSALKRMGLRRKYQRQCPYVLFGDGCNLDADDWAISATATAYSRCVVTIPGASLLGAFAGGVLRASDGSERTIVRHRTNAITLSRPMPFLEAEIAEHTEADVELFLACDKSLGTCRTRYGNAGNWGGSFIPALNPMSGIGTIVR